MNKPPLKSAFIGEFLGTALLILLGNGVVATVVLLEKEADWIVITTGWALGVMLGVYLSGRLSGGHINPAVTLAMAVRGQFPWPRVPVYWAAQVLGAFAGAMLVYLNYAEAFKAFEATHGLIRGTLVDGNLEGPATGGTGIFFTSPAFDVSWRSLVTEIVGTSVLLIGVRAVSDRRNAQFRGYFEPMLVGLIVFAIGLSLGGLTGYAINPARDFGPRLAAMFLGWGPAAFQTNGFYFWIPIVGPLIGGIIGVFIYDLLVHPNLPDEEEPTPTGSVVS